MTAQLFIFPDPNYLQPATPHDEPCLILILPVVRIEQECPKVQELRRLNRLLCEHFNWGFSGK